MGRSKFLQQVKPFLAFFPQIEAPKSNSNETTSLEDKALYTLGALLLFLVMSQTPLYGICPSSTPDPLHWFRPMLASNIGTLMELGVSPIVTSGLILQLMAGRKLLQIDQNDKNEKALFQATQKLFALLITVCMSFAFISSGIYGDWWSEIGIINSCLIILQLLIASTFLILLDEILQRGYGMGNGISLFIATNICSNIVWKIISPSTLDTASGVQYEGAIIALFHLLLTRKHMIPALKEAFYRSNLPNLTNVMSTILMFIIVIYFQGFRVDLPVKSTKLRGSQGQTKYPIKLFYTSNIPIVLYTAFVSNTCFFCQIVCNRFGSNLLTNVLGQWKTNLYNGISVPSGGLVYYMSPPRSIYDLIYDPIHAAVYTAFILATCAYFSVTWIKYSGSSARDVAKQLKDQGLVIRGYREKASHEVLQRYIPTAAAFGGVCIAALTVVADFMGALGTGSGILLAVTIIFEMFEAYVREAQNQGVQFAMPNMSW